MGASRQGQILDQCMPEPNTGCWIWLGTMSRDGYGKVSVDRRTVRAHRASWECFRGSIPEGMLVCHKCDVPLCVNPDHLFLGTPRDNTMDMVRKGRAPWFIGSTGEDNPRSVLTRGDVWEIRELIGAGVSAPQIAKRYGTGVQTIYYTKWGTNWSWLK